MDFLQNLNINWLIITGLLILLGLYLENWQPPIKKQYISIILFMVGGSLSWYMLEGAWAYGILIAGLVFYKKELVEEVKEIKDSFMGIKDNLE